MRHGLWRLALRINRVMRRARAAALFPLAAVRYDAFILGGHETFLGGIDLWILRGLRKPVIIVFTGSDHRPPFLSGKGIRLHGDARSMIRASFTGLCHFQASPRRAMPFRHGRVAIT